MHLTSSMRGKETSESTREMSIHNVGAASPFAPPGRNNFLELSKHGSCHLGKGVLLLLFAVLRFWRTETGKQVSEYVLSKFEMAIRILIVPKTFASQASPLVRNDDSFLMNQRLIESVLMYWFGQSPPDASQKRLWMIASSSDNQRAKVDREISKKFRLIIEDQLYSDWSLEIFGYRGKLAMIIVLDQFSRHIRRDDETHRNNRTMPSQSSLDKIAYETAEKFATVHKQEIECSMIPLPMSVFALMPFRHTNDLKSVQFVQQNIQKLCELQEQCNSMLGRFRKATNRRCAILLDENRRTGGRERKHIHDDIDILETFPFDADMAPSCNHVVHKAVIDFLGLRGIHPTTTSSDLPVRHVIVSLSGGVDSMVIASILAHLVRDCGYNIKVLAIHIDYANRPESGTEAAYVKRYCEEQQIRFCLRKIDEVTRGVTARDEYEQVAREARYQFYRETITQCRSENCDSSMEVGVILGHHRGDLRENVLSNSHKGSGPLDLSGMTAVSVNDRVIIYRPLLLLEKKDIFDYAHRFGVPYFKDTTPHWSTRGKLRNKLLPLLEEIYGEGSMNNLSNLAAESDQARALLHESVLGPFLDQVEHYPMGIAFHTQAWKNQGIFFWKFVLREALHAASFGMFSDKSVESFMKRIQSETLKEGWLQCRRDYAVFLRGDGKVFVLFPDSFPFQKSEQFDCIGCFLQWNEEKKIGPWVISAGVVKDITVRSKSELLDKRAVDSWETFMLGKIQYYLEIPSSTLKFRPLVFVAEFTKSCRPPAWKRTDLRIQSTLPLLGNDEESNRQLLEGTISAIAKVTLDLVTEDRIESPLP